MAPLLSLSLLGSLHVTVDDKPAVGFRSAKSQALLVYLVLEHKLPLRRDALMSLFWPDEPQDVARTNLRQSLARLQKVIGNKSADPPYLLISRETVQFNQASRHKVDVGEFEQRLSACEKHGGQANAMCASCVENLQTAVKLYRGDFLAHFFVEDSQPFESWLLLIRERLHQRMLDSLEWLAAYHENRGQYDAALHYSRLQVEMEPWREGAYQQQMRLLMRQGKRTSAIALYQTCCIVLEKELGVTPSPETVSLYQQIEEGEAERPHNLRHQTTSFLGREEESSQLLHYLVLPQQRLITLMGPGGSGKTSLALYVAQRVAAEYVGPFVDGVFWVSLVDIDTEEGFVAAIANVLQISLSSASAPRAQLFKALVGKELLLVFDNFEQLVGQGGDFVRDLLQQTEHVKCLITSRGRLNLSYEWVVMLDGLPFPPATFIPSVDAAQLEDFSAIQLFVDRAQHVASNFELGTEREQRTAVMRIVQMLHGMPLAVELAAAWVNILTCTEIAAEIARNLDILETTQQDVPSRHRSIRAVFEHSWALLTLREKRALSQLSVFPGSFDHKAARQIATASLPILVNLSNKSLLKQEASAFGTRHRFHALLRQFAAEKRSQFVDDEEVSNRHSIYFANYLAEREQALLTNQDQALPELNSEIENLRAGWRWAVETGQMVVVAQYLKGLSEFYLLSGWLYEAQQTFGWAVGVLQQFGPFDPEENEKEALVFARTLARHGQFHYNTGSLKEAEHYLRQSLAISHQIEEPRELLLAYKMLGLATYIQGSYKSAVSYLDFSRQLAEHLEDQNELAHIQLSSGAVAVAQGLYDAADQHLGSALSTYQALNHQWGVAQTYRWLGVSAYRSGEHESAQDLRGKAHDIFHQLNDQAGLAIIWNDLGESAQAREEYELAHDFYHKSLVLSQEIHHRINATITLRNLGTLQLRLGKREQAASSLHLGFQKAVESQSIAIILTYFVAIAELWRQSAQRADYRTSAVELLTAVYFHSATNHFLCQQTVQELADWDIPTPQQPHQHVDDAYILRKSVKLEQLFS